MAHQSLLHSQPASSSSSSSSSAAAATAAAQLIQIRRAITVKKTQKYNKMQFEMTYNTSNIPLIIYHHLHRYSNNKMVKI